MSFLAYSVLTLLALNSLYTVSDYYSQVTALQTPGNVHAAVLQYTLPGKEYYLQQLRTAWEEGVNAKNETSNMLALYLKEGVSNLFFSSYCKSKLRLVYDSAAQAFYGTVSLLERDEAVLRDAGVENPGYSGRAKPAYLSIRQAVSAVEHPENNSSSEEAGRIRAGLRARNANYYNTLVGYPSGLFKTMLQEHGKFLNALKDLEAEYKQALAEAEYQDKRLSYRVKEYEANHLDRIAWNRIQTRAKSLSGEHSEAPARTYHKSREWFLKSRAVISSAKAAYSSGRRADAIVMLHDHAKRTAEVADSMEKAMKSAQEIEEELYETAVAEFSRASKESRVYKIAEEACSRQSPLLGDRIMFLQECIRLSEKTREPEPVSEEEIEKEALAENLSRLAWEKYYELEQYLNDSEFLDRIRTSLQILDSSNPDPVDAAAEYQELILQMDEKKAGLYSEYTVVLDNRILECGKEEEVNATVYFSGPKASVYRARVSLPDRVTFHDRSKEKVLSSQNSSLRIPVTVFPECSLESEEQRNADDRLVYYEAEYKVRSPLPVRLADGTVTLSGAKIVVQKPSWLVTSVREKEGVLTLTVFNPGDSLRNVMLSSGTDKQVEECDSCITKNGRIFFFIPEIRSGEKKVLQARLSEENKINLAQGSENNPEQYSEKFLTPEINKTSYESFLGSRFYSSDPEPPWPEYNETGQVISLKEPEKTVLEQHDPLPVSKEVGENKGQEGGQEPVPRASGEENDSYKYYVIPMGFAVLGFMLLKKRPVKRKVGRVI